MKRDRHNKSLLKCKYNKYLITVFYLFCILPGSNKKISGGSLNYLTNRIQKTNKIHKLFPNRMLIFFTRPTY